MNLAEEHFGELADVLKTTAPINDEGFRVAGARTMNIMGSAGPISDAYILATDPVMLIDGPIGSGKTTASVKKAIVEARRMRPIDGKRRYVLGVWRAKYDNLWKATLPSWWKVLPRDLPGSTFTGSSPRAAEHIIRFKDKWSLQGGGDIEIVARFRAFGEVADPDDIRGNEFTDCYLNEMDTLPEELFTNLLGRIGRDPPRELIGRSGRIFGDENAPDVLNWTYRDFWEAPKDGYARFHQPGGREAGAENLAAMGRGYYDDAARLNAHRKWWVKRMVDNRPGFTRDSDMVYPAWDDERNLAAAAIPVLAGLPVVVGIDGGLTPAATYSQFTAEGQKRTLAEIAMQRGGMLELARAMLELEARRFPGVPREDFLTACDPAMCAGEDVDDGSDRQRLAKHLGRKVKAARTNETGARWDANRAYLGRTLENGAPGYLLDPSCSGLRRGFNQTYHFVKLRGSNEVSRVEKTFDSHVHDADQYAALEGGEALGLRNAKAERERKAARAGQAKGARYNPLSRGSR